MEYYSVVKRSKADTCCNAGKLENMRHERRQTHKSHIVRCCIYKVSGTGRSIQTGSTLVVASGWE